MCYVNVLHWVTVVRCALVELSLFYSLFTFVSWHSLASFVDMLSDISYGTTSNFRRFMAIR
jgi:hypothetical protein